MSGFGRTVNDFHDGNEPTLRSVIEHAQRALSSNLERPIIISEKFGVMDGLHRIMKAHIIGCSTIRAVIVSDTPAPDYIGEL